MPESHDHMVCQQDPPNTKVFDPPSLTRRVDEPLASQVQHIPVV